MSTTRKDHWDSVYAERAEDRVSWFQTDPQPSLGLIESYATIPDTGIIDIGAGASRLADALLAAGHTDITLLDISNHALLLTSERLGAKTSTVTLIAADVTLWSPPRHWDVWHDRAVFHFLTEEADQNAYLAALHGATRVGATVIMGTFALDGPDNCSGLPVQRYSPQTLATRLGTDFALLESVAPVHLTPLLAEQKYSFSVFRRL